MFLVSAMEKLKKYFEKRKQNKKQTLFFWRLEIILEIVIFKAKHYFFLLPSQISCIPYDNLFLFF